MNNDILYWIWLSELKGVGPNISKKLLDKFYTTLNIYNATIEEIRLVKGIGDILANKIFNNKSLEKSKIILKNCYKNNIKITTIHDDNFPNKIKLYENMPILLYYKGKINNFLDGIAIVGSRRCSSYAKDVTVDIVKVLAQNNIPVISGMAKGIDGYAHSQCINSNGFTVAILACRLDICYPKEHNLLMDKIIESGCIISEYPPEIKPTIYNFPNRNRLISALAEKVLNIEASENSGALITAKYAIEQNKEVLAIPNNIYSIESKGSNNLILEGATICLNKKQLLYKNIFLEEKNEISSIKSEDEDNMLLNILKNNKRTLEELVKLSKRKKEEVINEMILLELEGKVFKKGIYYNIINS